MIVCSTHVLGSGAHRDEAEAIAESSDEDIEPPPKKQRKERTKKIGLIVIFLVFGHDSISTYSVRHRWIIKKLLTYDILRSSVARHSMPLVHH